MNHQEKSAIQKRHDLVLYSVPILDGTHTLNKPQQNNTDLELKPFIKQGNIFKKKKKKKYSCDIITSFPLMANRYSIIRNLPLTRLTYFLYTSGLFYYSYVCMYMGVFFVLFFYSLTFPIIKSSN